MSRARNRMTEERENGGYLESELRQGAGREWAEEAAEDEHLSELMRLRRMDLGAKAQELVDQGRRVRVETGPQTFAGAVTFAGSDYAVVARADDVVAVKLDAATWTVEQIEATEQAQPGGAETLTAHLAELSSTGETVRLIVSDGRALVGSISVVATDHLEVDQGGPPVVVPLRMLLAVIRPKPGF